MIPLRPHCNPNEPHCSCPTCRDEGLPARVLTVDEANNMVAVLMEDGEQSVALDLLDGVQEGDYLLVHLAMAIAKLNPVDVVEE